jgi:hypothetical protein
VPRVIVTAHSYQASNVSLSPPLLGRAFLTFTRLVSHRSASSPALPGRPPASNSPLKGTLTQDYRIMSSFHQQPHHAPQTCLSHGNIASPNFSPDGVPTGQRVLPRSNLTPHIHSPSATHTVDHAAAAEDQPTKMECTESLGSTKKVEVVAD